APPSSTLVPYTTLFRSGVLLAGAGSASAAVLIGVKTSPAYEQVPGTGGGTYFAWSRGFPARLFIQSDAGQPAVRVNNPHNAQARSEEHTSELQSRRDLV